MYLFFQCRIEFFFIEQVQWKRGHIHSQAFAHVHAYSHTSRNLYLLLRVIVFWLHDAAENTNALSITLEHSWHHICMHCPKSSLCFTTPPLKLWSPESLLKINHFFYWIILFFLFFSFSFHSCFVLLNHTPENSYRCFFSPVLKLPQIYSLYNDLHTWVSCCHLLFAVEQSTDLGFNTASAWVDWPFWRTSVSWYHSVSWSSGVVLMRSPIKKGVKERSN